MDIPNVTLAYDDVKEECVLNHTKLFVNRNLLQCYHNNRGYCSFGEKCKYQHFQEVCSKTLCRDSECKKRHPVICRYNDDCKFNKMNSCAFKHITAKNSRVSEKLEEQIKTATDEITSLKSEITALRNEIKRKEKELSKRSYENEQLREKLTLKQNYPDAEKDMRKENIDLKKQIEVLVKENIELKKQIEQKDKPFVENLEIEAKVSNLFQTKYSCEKCCLKFPSMEKIKKHKSEMHKITLTF